MDCRLLQFPHFHIVELHLGAVLAAGADQLSFGTSAGGLTPGQLAQVCFLNPIGVPAGFCPAGMLSNGEVVPVPEPATVLAAAAFLSLLGWQRTPPPRPPDQTPKPPLTPP